MAGFWGAAIQGQQDAMQNFIARKQAEQRLQIEQQQQERLRQQAQLQDYEFAQRQRMQPYEEQLKQQQIERGALDIAALKQAQGFAGELPQQPIPPTVQPGVQSQPVQQGIPGGQQQLVQTQIQPWRSVPQPGQQMQPQGVIPPRPAKEQMEQQFDVGQTQDLAKMQQGLQVISQQLMQSPNEPENAFRRWAGNDPSRNSPAGQEWFAKNKLPFHEKMYKAEVDNFNRQKQIFDEADKRQREERQFKSQELRDKRTQQLIGTLAQKGAEEKKGIPQETIDYYAQQSLSGDNTWQVGLARGKVGQKLIAAVKDRIPQLAKEQGIAPQEASAMKGQRDALINALKDRTKFVAAGTQFVNNFQKQADLVEKYMKTGAAGQVPVINRWIQAGRKSIAGDPEVTQLDTAIRGLAREHQRIVTGVTSNAQLHASAQQTADQLLNVSMSPEQIKSVLGVMREEAKNALDSGKQETDFLSTQLKTIGKQPESVKTDAGKKDDPLGIR